MPFFILTILEKHKNRDEYSKRYTCIFYSILLNKENTQKHMKSKILIY